MRIPFTPTAALLTILLVFPARAGAQATKVEPTLDIAITLSCVSDYRLRGNSMSDAKPAFQPSVTVTYRSGLYATAWASTLAENGGRDIELDLVAGIQRELGPVTVNFNATWYLCPGLKNADYVDLIGRLSTVVGPAELGLTVA